MKVRVRVRVRVRDAFEEVLRADVLDDLLRGLTHGDERRGHLQREAQRACKYERAACLGLGLGLAARARRLGMGSREVGAFGPHSGPRRITWP